MSERMKALKDFIQYKDPEETDLFTDKDEAFQEAGRRGDSWYVIYYYRCGFMDPEYFVTCDANRR